jgi:hypothetical protein
MSLKISYDSYRVEICGIERERDREKIMREEQIQMS